jgi:hypothetical protein
MTTFCFGVYIVNKSMLRTKEIRKQKSAGDTEYRVAGATSVAVPECFVIRSTISLSKEINLSKKDDLFCKLAR